MVTAKARILCMDDEPDILKFLEAVLVSRGYEVIRAGDGEEALRKFEGERIDLALLDAMVPNLDGFEVCRRVKGNERTRDIPVIMITGLSTKEDRIKGIEAGAEDFLCKPIDPAEVLARIKMLLKVRDLQERRIGEMLIEMGFITEQQLQEALFFANEQNLKVGEALNAMGVLDKDHLYWVLSTQLKVNYVELSPEMIDRELIKQFPIDLLEQFLCLPLYETMEEIHFAVADPTNPKIIKKVKSLKPAKTVHLNLALPEKIKDVLKFLRQEFPPTQPGKWVPLRRQEAPVSFDQITKSEKVSPLEQVWSDFVGHLFTLSQNEQYWLYKTPEGCHLLLKREKGFESLLEYPVEYHPLIKERLQQEARPQPSSKEVRFFLEEKTTRRQGAFALWEMDCLDREMIQITRIPVFSEEAFAKQYPHSPLLLEPLRHILHEQDRILIGGPNSLFIKQCVYATLFADQGVAPFPPPVFVESRIEMYCPGVAQFSCYPFGFAEFLDRFKETLPPTVFCEIEPPEAMADPEYFSKFDPGMPTRFILFDPFPSFESMQEDLVNREDWRRAGFKTFFVDPKGLKFMEEGPHYAKT